MQSELNWYDISLGKRVKAESYQQICMDVEYLSHWQTIIYQVISEHPVGICDKEIKRVIMDEFEIDLPISSICARRNELIDVGLVCAVGVMEYPDYSGMVRKNTLWGIC